MGRPTDFSQDLADKICTMLFCGGENDKPMSLRSICKMDDMPAMSTVFGWLAKDDKFLEQYTRARASQGDAFVDEIIDIADTETDPHKARNRIDARKWTAGQFNGKYSNSLKLIGDPTAPVMVKIVDDIS